MIIDYETRCFTLNYPIQIPIIERAETRIRALAPALTKAHHLGGWHAMTDIDSSISTVTFKSIAGFPFFRVGNDGSVWSELRRGSRNNATSGWHKLPGQIAKSGHVRASIRDESGRWIKVFAHVLVLEAFVGPAPSGMECLHGDGNPQNNRLENLRWGTRKENVADSRKHGTISAGERNGHAKLRTADIPIIRTLLTLGVTQRDIARRFNVSQPTISAVARSHRWASSVS